MPFIKRGPAASFLTRRLDVQTRSLAANLRLAHQARGDAGFTLIELLVVVLIIGILAGVAIPVFLNQQGKATDAIAKANVATLKTSLASCYVQAQDYSQCQTAAALPDDQIPWGTSPGQGEILWQPYGLNAVAVVAYASNGDLFGSIQTLPDNTVSRICQVAGNTYPSNGCKRGGTYSAYGYGQW